MYRHEQGGGRACSEAADRRLIVVAGASTWSEMLEIRASRQSPISCECFCSSVCAVSQLNTFCCTGQQQLQALHGEYMAAGQPRGSHDLIKLAAYTGCSASAFKQTTLALTCEVALTADSRYNATHQLA